MISTAENNIIRTSAQPICYVCQSAGKIVYQGLTDRIFQAGGVWNIKQCLNPKCNLLWLDPRPVKEDIGKTYLDYYTHSGKDGSAKSPLRRFIDFIKFGYLAAEYGYHLGSFWQKLLGRLVYLDSGLKSEIDFEIMYLKEKPGASLLDVGCGNGRFLELMQKLGWQTEGVEVDKKAVEVCRDKGLTVKLGELREQNYPDNFFDVVTLGDVIEHLPEPLAVLKECRRILKKNGFLVMITPNTKSRLHRIFKDKWFHLDPPRHLYLFSADNLKQLMEQAGFQKIKTWLTARNLRSSLLGSWDIKKKGCHKMGGRQSIFRRIAAKLLQFSNIGDEIVLTAQK